MKIKKTPLLLGLSATLLFSTPVLTHAAKLNQGYLTGDAKKGSVIKLSRYHKTYLKKAVKKSGHFKFKLSGKLKSGHYRLTIKNGKKTIVKYLAFKAKSAKVFATDNQNQIDQGKILQAKQQVVADARATANMQSQIDKLNEKVKEMQATKVPDQKQIDNLKNQIDNLKKEVSQKDSWLNSLQSTLNDLKKQISTAKVTTTAATDTQAAQQQIADLQALYDKQSKSLENLNQAAAMWINDPKRSADIEQTSVKQVQKDLNEAKKLPETTESQRVYKANRIADLNHNLYFYQSLVNYYQNLYETVRNAGGIQPLRDAIGELQASLTQIQRQIDQLSGKKVQPEKPTTPGTISVEGPSTPAPDKQATGNAVKPANKDSEKKTVSTNSITQPVGQKYPKQAETSKISPFTIPEGIKPVIIDAKTMPQSVDQMKQVLAPLYSQISDMQELIAKMKQPYEYFINLNVEAQPFNPQAQTKVANNLKNAKDQLTQIQELPATPAKKVLVDSLNGQISIAEKYADDAAHVLKTVESAGGFDMLAATAKTYIQQWNNINDVLKTDLDNLKNVEEQFGPYLIAKGHRQIADTITQKNIQISGLQNQIQKYSDEITSLQGIKVELENYKNFNETDLQKMVDEYKDAVKLLNTLPSDSKNPSMINLFNNQLSADSQALNNYKKVGGPTAVQSKIDYLTQMQQDLNGQINALHAEAYNLFQQLK